MFQAFSGNSPPVRGGMSPAAAYWLITRKNAGHIPHGCPAHVYRRFSQIEIIPSPEFSL
jgi:hypothetical protein